MSKNKLSQYEGGVNLYDLVKYVHVPQVNQIFALTVAMLNKGKKDKIKSYKWNVHRALKEMATDNRRSRARAGKMEYPPLYKFEMSPYSHGDWGLTTVSPWPPPFNPPILMLPQDIIDQLIHYPVDPQIIISRKGIYSQSAKKAMDIHFIRQSESHIFGIMRDNIDPWEEKLKHPERITPEELEEDSELAYQLHLYYLHRSPAFREEYIREFLTEMLPRLEEMKQKEVIHITPLDQKKNKK
ncbi:MAG: hypothetical protein GY940_29655 [bacterium]|nr:hypothetical protein [bacterium]